MEILLLIFIPLTAGVLAYFLKNLSTRIFKLILALSGAFVLAMCFMHLLPHVYHVLSDVYTAAGRLTL